MVIKTDSLLNKMSKDQLKQIISQYDVIVDNLKHQILLLKYQIFLETPNLQFKIPVQIFEEDEQDDIPSVVDPNLSIKKNDLMFQ